METGTNDRSPSTAQRARLSSAPPQAKGCALFVPRCRRAGRRQGLDSAEPSSDFARAAFPRQARTEGCPSAFLGATGGARPSRPEPFDRRRPLHWSSAGVAPLGCVGHSGPLAGPCEAFRWPATPAAIGSARSPGASLPPCPAASDGTRRSAANLLQIYRAELSALWSRMDSPLAGHDPAMSMNRLRSIRTPLAPSVRRAERRLVRSSQSRSGFHPRTRAGGAETCSER